MKFGNGALITKAESNRLTERSTRNEAFKRTATSIFKIFNQVEKVLRFSSEESETPFGQNCTQLRSQRSCEQVFTFVYSAVLGNIRKTPNIYN